MLSFLHSADWQIGKPYARVQDPDKRAKLRQVRIAAIDQIAQCAKEQAAAFLLVAGDLFDSPTPSSSDISAVCQALGRLSCPVLVIPGNHDHGAQAVSGTNVFSRRSASAGPPTSRCS